MAVATPPTPFTAHDFSSRMERAAQQADEAGLTGVLVAPGPDLQYLTGYMPVAITERLTMLVLQAGREPAMILPVLERPDAELAPSAGTIALTDWTDGSDPYAAAAPLLDPHGRYAISDSAWAMHVLGLQERLPGTEHVQDRKSTRLNSSHPSISYAVFCLKKKKNAQGNEYPRHRQVMSK